MKTDRVLTADECFNEWGAVPMHVDRPTCDARHIPIAEEKDADLRRNARSCNCDRWGHPCPSCVEPAPNAAGASDFHTCQTTNIIKWDT
jgi:hypothetical protein